MKEDFFERTEKALRDDFIAVILEYLTFCSEDIKKGDLSNIKTLLGKS